MLLLTAPIPGGPDGSFWKCSSLEVFELVLFHSSVFNWESHINKTCPWWLEKASKVPVLFPPH